jgi:hypothetical protein
MALGCYPLLPCRLSYPELLPTEYHESCLYRSEDELVEKLYTALTDAGLRSQADGIAAHMRRFDWRLRIGEFDEAIEELGRRQRS